MNKKRNALLLPMTLLLAGCSHYEKVEIDFTKKGNDIPETMYGLFFEEINHAGDGGLYAELLQNRSFEEHVIPGGMTYRDGYVYAPVATNYYGMDSTRWHAPWNIEELKMRGWEINGTPGTYTFDVHEVKNPLHRNTPNAMVLQLGKDVAANPVQLVNTGYWGIPMKAGAKYDLRFYLCSDDYRGSVTAEVFDPADGRVIAADEFEVKSDGKWHEYTSVLQAGETDSDCRFRLVFNAPGTMMADYVSLFPQDTFMGRRNGLRKDIAQKLADLHPAFLRWPGGCIVEGITLGNRVRWEETIGDPMTRPGQFSLWGYRNSYGFGYHEFLQFCEDLNMDAMFVANAGLSCSIRNGDYVSGKSALDPFLEEIENAIEYATGDVTTKYGAMRSANGHPEPFRLKYVEIGNENGTERYTENFNYLYGKLKAAHPDITFINTLTWWNNEIATVDSLDMIDPHWYENPAYFFNSASLFDEAPRGNYDIYVGEYACNNGVGSGNLEAALSEAAFMMGMERNSDIVKMSSYAPLLTNVNAPNWACNLIWFDKTRTSGRASYYVQKLFAENRPDYSVDVTPLTGDAVAIPIAKGTIGLGSWDTQVEFKEMNITAGKNTYAVSSDSLHSVRGEWLREGPSVAQTSGISPSMCWLKGFESDTYTFECQARKTGGKEGFLIYFGLHDDASKGYAFNIGGWNNTGTNIEAVVDSRLGGTLGNQVAQTIETGRWYKIRMEVSPASAALFVDDVRIIQWNGQAYPLQFFSAGYDSAAGEAVIKAVNASDKPYKADFVLNGLVSVESVGSVTTLRSESLYDENSLESPELIVPASEQFKSFGKQFHYSLQPYSLTVFRIKAKI